MKLSPKAQQTLILVIAVLLVLWYLKGKAGEAAAKVVQSVNPTDNRNLANRLFDWAYQGVTGSDDTLGADVADWLHNDEEG